MDYTKDLVWKSQKITDCNRHLKEATGYSSWNNVTCNNWYDDTSLNIEVFNNNFSFEKFKQKLALSSIKIILSQIRYVYKQDLALNKH